MSYLKIKRSRIPGYKPNVNHFPDTDTAIWNQADGKLWGLRVDEQGNKSVVLIGGGINTIGEVHSRLHSMTSELDHAPATVEEYGKYFRYSPVTGKVETVALDAILPVSISKWITPPVNEIVSEYPISPTNGFRVIYTVDNKIYTYDEDTTSWILDAQTELLEGGSGVVVYDSPEGENQIYYYNEPEDEWQHVGDASTIDEGMFLTIYVNEKRQARPIFITHINQINQAGQYAIFESAVAGIPSVGMDVGYAIIDAKFVNEGIGVFEYYRISSNRRFFTVIITGELGEWREITEDHIRLHSMISESDHAPADQDHWGKYVRAEPGTGKIIFDDLPLQGVAIVLVEGMAGYIEKHQHNLGANIQVDFYHVYLDGEETKRELVEVHYEINSVGRIYWVSSFPMSSHIAVIK